MTGVIDSFGFILSKSFNWKFWLYVIAVSIIGMVAFVVSTVIFVLIAVIAFIALTFTTAGIVVYFIIFLLWLIVMLLVGAALQGTLLNFSRHYLESGNLDIWSSFGKTKPRIFTSVKVEIIIGLIYFILFVLCFLPFIFAFINFLYSITPAELALKAVMAESDPSVFFGLFVPLLFSLILSFILCFIVFLILTPFSVIYKQIPFFENESTFGSIKRALHLAKKNYFRNLGFALLFFLFIGVITLIYLFLIVVFTVPLTAGNLGALVFLLVFLRIIVELFYSFWVTVLGFLFDAKIYLFDTESESHSMQAYQKKEVQVVKPVQKPAKDFLAEAQANKKPAVKAVQKPAVKKPVSKKSFNTEFPESFLPKKGAKASGKKTLKKK